MSDIDKPLSDDAHNVTLTIRMIMNGKEVGSIIGKGGEIINNIREESGAKIHITDGSVPERIVTVTGNTDGILKAFNMICKKIEDDGSRDGGNSGSIPKPPITLRLVFPASQCGSLIGKGGSKIKEIREIAGVSIQVASEMLPNSTERAVTISGTKDAISQCIYKICLVMLESPAKGNTIPYSPKGGNLGMSGLLAGGSGFNRGPRGGNHYDNPLAGLLGLGGGASTLAALASLAGSQIRNDRRDSSRDSIQNYDMSIPNDLIGCIIGKGGSKIAEIRQFSGAMIRISKSDEGSSDNSERQISISGKSESVAVAKSLINMSLDMHKSKMEDRDNGRERGRDRSANRYGGQNNNSNGGGNPEIGLAQLLAKPEALTNALTTLATFGSLSGLGAGILSGLGGGGGNGHNNGNQVTGAHRSRNGGYNNSNRGTRDEDRRENKRSKFAPY